MWQLCYNKDMEILVVLFSVALIHTYFCLWILSLIDSMLIQIPVFAGACTTLSKLLFSHARKKGCVVIGTVFGVVGITVSIC